MANHFPDSISPFPPGNKPSNFYLQTPENFIRLFFFSWILDVPSPLALSQCLFIHSLTSLIFLNTFYMTGTVLGSEQ